MNAALNVKPKHVYMVIDRHNGTIQSAYDRSYRDVDEFNSVHEARTARCHGEFQDKKQYNIVKYKVTYTLIKEDCNLKD